MLTEQERKDILDFISIQSDLISYKQHCNDMIECILYNNLDKELTGKDIEKIRCYRIAIKKCYDMIDICNR